MFSCYHKGRVGEKLECIGPNQWRVVGKRPVLGKPKAANSRVRVFDANGDVVMPITHTRQKRSRQTIEQSNSARTAAAAAPAAAAAAAAATSSQTAAASAFQAAGAAAAAATSSQTAAASAFQAAGAAAAVAAPSQAAGLAALRIAVEAAALSASAFAPPPCTDSDSDTEHGRASKRTRLEEFEQKVSDLIRENPDEPPALFSPMPIQQPESGQSQTLDMKQIEAAAAAATFNAVAAIETASAVAGDAFAVAGAVSELGSVRVNDYSVLVCHPHAYYRPRRGPAPEPRFGLGVSIAAAASTAVDN